MKFFSAIAVVLLVVAQSFAAQIAVLRNGNTIPHERHEVLGAITRLYVGPDPTSYIEVPTEQIEHFEADPTPRVVPANPRIDKTALAPLNVGDAVNQSSNRYHLDPDFINSVIHAESGFKVRAVSPKGAQGLMQLMPQTAANLGVKNSFDPAGNVDGGTRYLRELLEMYNFDVVKALAAYNAGPHRVEKYKGVPPYRETQAYISRIIRDYNRKKLAQRKAATAAAKKSAATTKPKVATPITKSAALTNQSQQASR